MEENYAYLKSVLDKALNQASEGKGKERHANNEPFTEQLIFIIEKLVKSFQLGQAIKKIVESERLPKEMAKAELLGAINYISAHYIHIDTPKTQEELAKELKCYLWFDASLSEQMSKQATATQQAAYDNNYNRTGEIK
jgi:hypothetical protein